MAENGEGKVSVVPKTHEPPAVSRSYFGGIRCTACSNQITFSRSLKVHPKLKVVICSRCDAFLSDGPWTKDASGTDEFCTWCGQGGSLFVCDECKVLVFCKSCILRNLSRSYLSTIGESTWSCFVCNPTPIVALQEQCISVRRTAESEVASASHSTLQCFSALCKQFSRASAKLSDVSGRLHQNLQLIRSSRKTDLAAKERGIQDIRKNLTHSAKEMIRFCECSLEALERPLTVRLRDPSTGSLVTKELPSKRRPSTNKAARKSSDQSRSSDGSMVTATVISKGSKRTRSGHLRNDTIQLESSNSDSTEENPTKRALVSPDLFLDPPDSVTTVDSSSAEQETKEQDSIEVFKPDKLSTKSKAPRSRADSTASDSHTDPFWCSDTEEPLCRADVLQEIDKELEDAGDMNASASDSQIPSDGQITDVDNKSDAIAVKAELNEQEDVNGVQSADTEKKQKKAHPADYDSDLEKDLNACERALNAPLSTKKNTKRASKKRKVRRRNSADSSKESESESEDHDPPTTVDIIDDEHVTKLPVVELQQQSCRGKFLGEIDQILNDSDVESELEDEVVDSRKISKKRVSTDSDSRRNDEELQPKKPLSDVDKLLRCNLNPTTSSSAKKPLPEDRSKKRKTYRIASSNEGGSDIGDSESVAPELIEEIEGETSRPSTASSDVQIVSEEKKQKAKSTRKTRGRKKKRMIVQSTSSDSESGSEKESNTQKSGGRRNIRKMLASKHLEKTTLDAQAAERERKKRLHQLQQLYNNIDDESGRLEKAKVTRLELERDLETGEALVEVHPELVKVLAPHQVEGIKQMYESTIESITKLDTPPGGCILAHCMGLGKTLQVIAFLHTLLTNESLKIRTALVLCPLNVVLNWKAEIDKWTENVAPIPVWEMSTIKSISDRLHVVECWQDDGGIMILGYDIYRILVTPKKKVKEKDYQRFVNALQNPGPDIVICDEGHILRNPKTGINKTMTMINTQRRICLTGTPLQNNLSEYYCMVNFVKPRLLGTKQEFKNQFENPIKNGQCLDSTEGDVRLMKRRSHVLHSLLDGFVHRRDYDVLTNQLPPRYEFVLSISLSMKQIELYQIYLKDVVGKIDLQSLQARNRLFSDFHVLLRICSHPYALVLHQQAMRQKDNKEIDDFITDCGSASTPTSSSETPWSDMNDDKPGTSGNAHEGAIGIRSTRQRNAEPVCESLASVVTPDWWTNLVTEEDFAKIETSGKMEMLFEIVNKCDEIGDKILVFSQSLYTLDIIEHFFAAMDEDKSKQSETCRALNWSWKPELDYFRMDGSTNAHYRKRCIQKFNDPNNARARLFLLSTKAGSLGTNLIAANRVVIFDASWNPSHDVQALFRCYRYGQTKPVYIYRLVAQGTMEERIYDRQVAKLSMALRVVDEHQIVRRFTTADLEALYHFDPDALKCKQKHPMPAVPKDRLLGDLLLDKKQLLITYHEHDSLLQNVEEERLSEAEKEEAWNEYRTARTGLRPATTTDPLLAIASRFPLIGQIINEADIFMQQNALECPPLSQLCRSWLLQDPTLSAQPLRVLAMLKEALQLVFGQVPLNRIQGGQLESIFRHDRI